MNLFKIFLLLFASLFNTYILSAQESEMIEQDIISIKNPPINFEGLFSNRGMSYQVIVNKKLQSINRLGFFTVTNFVGEWKQRAIQDYMILGYVTFRVAKGWDLIGGFHVSSGTGFRSTFGFMYSYATPTFLFVFNPRVDLSKDAAVEGFILAEYRPKLTKQWSLYTRFQGLYAYVPEHQQHGRSYLNFRLGLTYKDINFGLGTNLDWYGPARVNMNSFGGFLNILLF